MARHGVCPAEEVGTGCAEHRREHPALVAPFGAGSGSAMRLMNLSIVLTMGLAATLVITIWIGLWMGFPPP